MCRCDDTSLWNGYSYLPRDTSLVMKYIFSFYWALGMLTGNYFLEYDATTLTPEYTL